MAYKYCLEKVALNPHAAYQSWRWKQIVLSNDLESLKEMCTNKHRIIDLSNLEEVYRTAPNNHFSLMALATTT
jgi:hypothetical protein